MRYYVELLDNINDLTRGRLYPVNDNCCVQDDVEDERHVEGLEDQTGYVVEI